MDLQTAHRNATGASYTSQGGTPEDSLPAGGGTLVFERFEQFAGSLASYIPPDTETCHETWQEPSRADERREVDDEFSGGGNRRDSWSTTSRAF